MGKQEAAEALGEFGPLFHHLGIRLADQYKHQQRTLEYFVRTLHSILKICRDDDRHAILVVIAVSLLDVYHDSTISKKLFKVIAQEGGVSIETFFSDTPGKGRYFLVTLDEEDHALNEAFSRLQDFLQRTPLLQSSGRADFLDRAEGFTAIKELSCRSSINDDSRSRYCLNVCAFIACAGYENLPMLFSKRSSYVKNLFLRNVPKVGSYGMVVAVNRLWNQFKLYDCHGSQGDRFILPVLLSRNPEVTATLEAKEELTSRQLMKLVETAEELLPVLEAATVAAENSFCDGLHTKLPEYWMIDYVVKDGVVDYGAREHDYELLGWVYQQCGAHLAATFTEEPVVSDEDLAL
jgi:hypothetical protein